MNNIKIIETKSGNINFKYSLVGDDALEGGDAALNFGFREEAKDTKLRKTAVVELSEKALLLFLVRHVLVLTERVVEVESATGNVLVIERRELADLSTLHVVLFGRYFAPLNVWVRKE